MKKKDVIIVEFNKPDSKEFKEFWNMKEKWLNKEYCEAIKNLTFLDS